MSKLKFGLTPLEGDSIKKIFNPEKGLNSLQEFRFSSLILELITHGFSHCEITLDLFQVLPIQLDDLEKQTIKRLKKEYDITFSAHFPIWSIELSSPNKFIREASVQSCIDSYNKFKFLESDIDVFVIHPTGSLSAELMNFDFEESVKNVVLDLLNNYAIESIKKIIKTTKIRPAKLAIENIQFPFQKTVEIIKSLKGTKMCLDTAHLLGGFSGTLDLMEITERYLDIVSEIHLQDYSNDNWPPDHVALGRGEHFPIDFLKFIKEHNFEGPIVFELDLEQAIESLQFIQKHVPEIPIPKIKK